MPFWRQDALLPKNYLMFNEPELTHNHVIGCKPPYVLKNTKSNGAFVWAQNSHRVYTGCEFCFQSNAPYVRSRWRHFWPGVHNSLLLDGHWSYALHKHIPPRARQRCRWARRDLWRHDAPWDFPSSVGASGRTTACVGRHDVRLTAMARFRGSPPGTFPITSTTNDPDQLSWE